MVLNYFKNVESLEELKKQFKQLAKKFHPDAGGSNEDMQQINNEYDYLKEKLGQADNSKAHTSAEAETDFREVIINIIHLEGIVIEICGSWIWVSGDTKPHKEKLKSSGFQWAPKKKMWYWKPYETKKKPRTSTPMEEIRERYGSQKVRKEETPKIAKRPAATGRN